jgi:hypothetical protein
MVTVRRNGDENIFKNISYNIRSVIGYETHRFYLRQITVKAA